MIYYNSPPFCCYNDWGNALNCHQSIYIVYSQTNPAKDFDSVPHETLLSPETTIVQLVLHGGSPLS